MKGMINMSAILLTIDKIIDKPSKKFSKKEAEQILKSCGILDRNYKIKPIYKDIIVKEHTKNESK